MRQRILALWIVCAGCSSGGRSSDIDSSTSDAGATDAGGALDASLASDGSPSISTSDTVDAGASLELNPATTSPLVLDDLTVSGVQAPLKPDFDPSRVRYSLLANDPAEPLLVAASAASDLDIAVDGIPTTSGVPVELGDVVPGSEFDVVVGDSDGNQQAYTLVYLPADFPDLRVTTRQPRAASHPIYVTPSRGSVRYVAKLDNFGVPFFYREVPYRVFDFKRHPDGRMSYALDPGGAAGAEHVVLNANFEEIDRLTTAGLVNTDEHEFHILANGNYLMLAYEPAQHDATEYGGEANQAVRDAVLQELNPNQEVLFEWNSWGHLPWNQSLYSLDDYAHVNSLAVDHDGHWLISSRGLSQVVKINRDTGDIMWRLGGLANEFTFINDPFEHLCGQHTVSRLDNGHILLFDNGQYCAPVATARGDLTRIVEYALDEDAKTAELVWSYSRPGAYTISQGSAQRLDNGNTFIGWGLGTGLLATEVDPGGNVVFELEGCAPEARSVSYRAWRFAD